MNDGGATAVSNGKNLNVGYLIANTLATIVLIIYVILCVLWFGYFQQNSQTSKLNYYSSSSYGTTDYEPMENRRIFLTAVGANIAIVAAAAYVGKNKMGDFLAIAIGGLMLFVNLVYLIVSLVYDGVPCNTDGKGPNLCRDRRFCCIPEYYKNTANLCAKAANYSGSGAVCSGELATLKISQLSPDTDYIILMLFIAVSMVAGGACALLGYFHYSPIDAIVNPLVEFVSSAKKRFEIAEEERSTNAANMRKMMKKKKSKH